MCRDKGKQLHKKQGSSDMRRRGKDCEDGKRERSKLLLLA